MKKLLPDIPLCLDGQNIKNISSIYNKNTPVSITCTICNNIITYATLSGFKNKNTIDGFICKKCKLQIRSKKLLDEPIPIATEEDVKSTKETYKAAQCVKFTCVSCSREFTRTVQKLHWPLRCRGCEVTSSFNEKYGSNPFTWESSKEKARIAAKTKKAKNKWKETIYKKYGSYSYFKTDDFKKKAKETMVSRYDVEYSSQSQIKGDQFWKDNKLYDPYTKTYNIPKTKCLNDNNVKILFKKDILPIINYINNRYGEKYLESFRNEKNKS